MLPFIVAGLATGSIFGLAAIGLVLTYKTSGLLNFAHGAVAAVGAYVFYELHDLHKVGWPVAIVLSICITGVVFGLLLERLAVVLVPLGTVAQVMGTVGVLLAIQGVAAARYGTAVRSFPAFLPVRSFDLLGVRVGWDQCIVAMFSAAAAAALFVFLRRTRTGTAMRAVVDDPSLLALAGTSPKRVRRLSWIVGTSVAAASGVLIAPELGLDATLLTLLVVQAFGAAAVGRFGGLLTTYLGGLLIGVIGSVSTRYVGDVSFLSGFRPSLPFLVLFAALVVLPPRETRADQRDGAGRFKSRAPTGFPVGLVVAGILAALVLLSIPQLVGPDLYAYTKGLTFVILFLSLGLLVRTSGQISLAHATFAGLGAAAFSHLTTGWGLPWPIALIATGAITVPVAAIIVVPAMRLSGIYLALATMGFSLLMEYMFFPMSFLFGIAGNRPAPRPSLGGHAVGDTGFYYIVVFLVFVTLAIVVLLQRSRLGRLLQSLSDSPSALSSLGTNVRLTLVIVFCLTGFLAAIGGALLGAGSGTVSGTGFSVFDSLTWIVVLALAGRSVIPAAFVASFILTVLPIYLPNSAADHQELFFGIAAIIGAVLSGRPEIFRPWLRTLVPAARDRARHSPIGSRLAEAA